ncbi:hypothetical protein M5C72_06375 [Companilactobacillus allii]|uniref:Tropomyosin n=1 Tax=Companilactobacillus allii TaxID=1847728 RepID=A0A1P8Q4E6_9LACO|nr:hypothetical protein [Companilactobacillus allii]APX72728.1 hypothetical protein BTM29_09275 [Companilactobacillus allii]USQ67513.1 hypothetical protein M5C72_06375 [Companilactobacillus allii]
MIDTVRVAISAVVGGAVTGIFGVWLQRTKNKGSNESIYADHTQELFDRLDKITQERDDLKEQVIKLNNQVQKQSNIIDSLTKQVGNLNEKFDLMEEK